MQQSFGDQNFIYVYDLPKDGVSSTKLAQAFEEQAGVSLVDTKPQIRRDPLRPFYSGIIHIKDEVKLNEAAEAMRYFKINDKWCRALKFDKQLLGSNKEKLLNHNVFIRKIPADLSHQDLHNKFSAFGAIKSLKVSLNADHSSRGYGFICFQDENSATAAVAGSENDESVVAMKFEIKAQRSMFALINNVYVKNIPLEMSDEAVKELFAPFGNIKSLILNKNEDVKNYQFGFVCYDQKPGEAKDPQYGPACAQKAIEALHGRKMDNNLQLYVRAAMKKEDRQTEKMRDTIRYKTSKKRCNLYVKNFPAEWEEENLKELFEKYGEIEKIKLEKKGSACFAFVCYRTPEGAATAKQNLHNQTIEGKSLIINHYEIKEVRELQREEAIDKSNYEQYLAQKTGGFHLNDLITHPHMTQILQQLLEIMQTNEAMNTHFNQGDRGGNYRGGQGRPQHHQQRGQYQQRGGHHQGQYQGHGQGQNQQQMSGMPGPQGGMQQQRGGMPQAPQPGMPGMPGAPQGMPGMPGAPQGGMPGVPQQVNQANMSLHQKYLMSTQKLLPSVTERNQYLKDQVGQTIYEYVAQMVPQDRAPKITGMLIELPIDQIKGYMQSLDALKGKVIEATTLIDNAEQAGAI